jgi:uncharacterized protein (TIGR00645 family)
VTEPTETKSLVERIGETIFAIRWGLAPMYVGLWIAVVAYNIQFFREIFDFTLGFQNGHLIFKQVDSEMFLMWVLGLIDITMVANLVVMIVIGGYSTFVKEFDLKRLEGKPRWMNKLDSNVLKIKMSMSLIGISAIQLLRTFMQISNQLNDMITHNLHDLVMAEIISINVGLQVGVHLVFIVTTLGFTYNARLLHSHNESTEDH